jgi:hypothetical protein
MAVDDAYTKVLLHFNLVGATSDIIDESSKAWTTASSNAEISTANYKFGGGSIAFTGTSDVITTPDHADFTVGSDDFTYEFWLKFAADNATQYYLIDKRGTAANSDAQISIYKTTGKKINVYVGHGGTSISALTDGTIADTNWHHIAVVKYGTELAIYLDGTKGSTVGSATGAIIDNAIDLAIGGTNSGSQALVGNIDEFRFSNGIARYTANFTPPSSEFGPSSGESIYFADGFGIY